MSLYLVINLAAVSIPFIFSFHPKLQFYKKWMALLTGTFLIGTIFIFWDVIFTKSNVWGFNPQYLLGIYFFNLPIEEWLFFICIPYASIFTHYSLIKLKNFRLNIKVTSVITIFLSGISFMIAVIFHEKMYTFVTFSLNVVVLVVGWKYFRQVLSHFYLTYLVILIPFFLVNGILTGSFIENEVVWYNNTENLGLRILTIPVEDVFYGFNLLIMNVMIMELILNRKRLSAQNEFHSDI